MRTKNRLLLSAGALAAVVLAAGCVAPPPPKNPGNTTTTHPPPPPPTATSCPAVAANAAGPGSSSPIAGVSGVNGIARASVVIGSVVYVGGTFTSAVLPNGATAAARSNLAAFCLANGKLLTTFVGNTNGPVNALATDGTSLFVGGNFTTYRGVGSNRLVKVDAHSGARIAAFNPPQIPYFKALITDGVLALSYFGGNLYVGGDFGKIGNPIPNTPPAITVGNAAAFNGVNGTYTGWHADADKKVEAITATTNSVFIGGSFLNAAGSPHDKLAKLSRATGADSGVSYGTVGARPFDIAVGVSESIFVALGPASPGGTGLGNHITYFSPTGSSSAPYWTDAGPRNEVHAVELIGTRVYAGLLTGYSNPAVNPALRLLGIDYSKQPGAAGYLAWAPAVGGGTGVYGVAASSNGRMVVVGDFTSLGIAGLHGLAIFN
jgi:hypothetical protein